MVLLGGQVSTLHTITYGNDNAWERMNDFSTPLYLCNYEGASGRISCKVRNIKVYNRVLTNDELSDF